jgi:ArsR family transcriptional regulator, arsenate/arsenite/antimonite-responsive transcriptional repressor
MAVDLELAPKQKSPAGQPCCEPVVYPDIQRAQAERMATVAKALGDPIRMQLVDVLRKHAGQVCVRRSPPTSPVQYRALVSGPPAPRLSGVLVPFSKG